MKKRLFVGILLILAGVFVVAYPWLKAGYFEYEKNKLLNQRETMVEAGKLGGSNTPSLSNTESTDELNIEIWEEDTNSTMDIAYALDNIAGVITIEKINLRSPILDNASQKNLNMAICVVAGSPEMGGEGNYCLAGHKSRIYGRHFNRLMEIKKGDIVYLSNGVDEFSYIVIATMQVNPEDVWVMDNEADKKILTLITCDYSVEPIGRYIVRCELIE